jgi:hypothetical protein
MTNSKIGIEPRIQTLYAFQVGFHDLDRGDLFFLDLACELCGKKKRYIRPLHMHPFPGG